MKLSKKFKRKIQKNITIALASIALVTTTLAIIKLMDISMPLNTKIDSTSKESQTESVIGTRLENTDTITYIYDADDLAVFRDAVNSGDNYSGKTVYLMADIDLSSVCSSTLGSWTPIGATGTYFAGTFDGNYHTINNLYYNSSEYLTVGLFTRSTSTTIIQNLILENIEIINTNASTNTTDRKYAAGLIGYFSEGIVQNCGVESGNVSCGSTSNRNYVCVGGLLGGKNSSAFNSTAKILNCYNKASVKGYASTSSSYKGCVYSGGIIGYASYNYGLEISNCYNIGSIYASGKESLAGGITGYVARQNSYSTKIITLKNLYNVGTIKGKSGTVRTGGVIGANGYSGTSYSLSVSNSYCLTNTTYLYNGNTTSTSNRVAAATLKTYTSKLGNGFAYDIYNKNSGYPVLVWQNETPVMSLNINQKYIKIGETLRLNVVEKEEITKIIGTDYSASNFTWKSTNEDVATVNENGVVTGISDGYTTVYAYHETSGMYAMAIINVAKDFANPQIETGNGFTGILKSDGTVWTIGNNSNGQLGSGTTENKKEPVQVKIDEYAKLENIIKISVGTDHVLALTKDGKVYAWGANTYGQLGQNNTTSTNYAKPVLGENGENYLSNIVDISAGAYGSVAIDINGNAYVWGNGTYGEMGNSTTTSSNLPIKTTVKNSIQISIGAGHVGVLTSDGIIWSWGRNAYGEVGINSKIDISYPQKVALDFTEISLGQYHSLIKKVDGTVYAVGSYDAGRLGTESTANETKYIKNNLPSTVNENNKVKYIKAGRSASTILLTDGTVWSVGYGKSGELGNGNVVNSSSFVQGLTNEGNLENVLTIGRNNGDSVGTADTGYGLNTAVITTNGDIYTTGDNAYGQIGNNTTNSTNKYIKMGYVYFEYQDKSVEIGKDGYQIDKNKLQYIYSFLNAYCNEKVFSVGETKYTSLNETIAKVDKNGFIPVLDGVTGIAQIKIEDITNGYETYFTVILNKLEDTNTVKYIYSIDDLVKFRDSVKSGNDYAGKKVYLMADIDMSTVCSANKGSWIPIGANGKLFAGTFDGNYHTISNLYIKTDSYVNVGLFAKTSKTTIIQNVIMKNPSVYSSYTEYSRVAALVAFNYGKIVNCASIGGTVTGYQTKTATKYKAVVVGGVVGYNELGTILNSFNTSAISGTANTSNSNCQVRIGGVVGINNGGKISDCYNGGAVTGKGYYAWVGGVVGMSYRREDTTVKPIMSNLYNYGTLKTTSGTTTRIGGVTAANGTSSSVIGGTLTNSYCTDDTTYSYYYYSGSFKTATSGKVSSDALKTYANKLGKAFENDDLNINNGYPILYWQAQTIELNKRQAYIKTGENLQLNVITTEALVESLGVDIKNSDLVWKSTNEDVATVDKNGLVTGISDGYTTIYGYYEVAGMYTMCIINVAKEQANPQVETGEGFTAILKADGTVWTIGKNDNGELGDGTNEEKIEAVQVKIDANTYLTNIVKISAGANHVLALTKDGKVYAWGANTYGQLGQNNKESSNYAKLVLGESGNSKLDRIIDISAGSYGSTAVNQFGWVLVWGNGIYGEMGNTTTTINLTPTKSTLNTAISVSMGAGHVIAIGQNGYAYTWGRNSYGELGIGNTSNNTMVTEVLKDVVDAKASGYETIIRKVDDTVYVAGLNTDGQLAIGNTTNSKTFVKTNLPTTVTDTNKIKYISAGRTSTNILLTDGTVYISGKYGANQNSIEFEKAKVKDGNLENVLTIGRSNGEILSLDTAVINKSGRIYTIGSNTYGQIGNNTKDDSKYFAVMGYIEVMHPEKIVINVGDTTALTGDNFAYVEKYMNVYEEDITKVPLIPDGKIIDENIATYNEGTITANSIGKTTLVAKEMSTETLIYIPVIVVPKNGLVVPDVQTGNNFTVTLKSNGTVWTFGTNTYGELGIGDNIYRNSPEQVGILRDVVLEQISVGTSHVIALTQDGKIYTWGLNNKGQLGLGTTKNSNIPQQVNIPKSAEVVQVIKDTIVKVIANKNTSYAIAQSGKVYAWGEGYGKTPVQIDLELDIIDISSSYVLDINGNVYNKETKTRLEIVEKIKQISEGETHTVFLGENGTAYAIGSNTFGQFGDGTNVSNNENVVAIRNENLTDILRNIVKVEAGNGYTIAILENGKLVVFGSNQYRQIGTEEIGETNTIMENKCVTKLLDETKEKILTIDAGNSHVAIALQNGNVYTWGLGTEGQLGNGENENEIEAQLVGKNIIEVNTNNILLSVNRTLELEAKTTYFNLLQDISGEISYESKDESVVKVNEKTGEVIANSEGTTIIVVRENGTNNISVVQVKVLKEELTIEPQVQTNGSHTVTLKSNGTVWCYGNNENGELGNGTTKYSDEPVQAIFPEGTTIVQVDAGENFSVALDSEGYVWTWGANDYYQLGTSKLTNTATPTKIDGLSNITKIATGTYSVLVIDKNKNVYGWGLNSNGELGIGSYTNKVSTPTKAKYMSEIIDIAVGKNHSIALKSTGEVYVTGLNLYGQLGNNDTSIKKVNVFTKVENLNTVARISATDSGNIVSTVNGKVYTWGLNIYGELGQGDKVNKYKPTIVNNVENIVLVSGGKNHSILLDKKGKVYVAGANNYGYLGNGTTEESLGYIQLSNLNDVITISAGNTYTVIAKTDGTVWGFGDYNHGDKTLKSKTSSSVPMQVGNDTFGLGVTKITIKKSETVNITSNIVYSFNLIYLDKNNTEKLTYKSLNEEIAVVNEYGEVLGVRQGFTWVKAIEEDGTEHVVYVYVTDNESNYAPEVSSGKNFATVLKSDGTIWTFGHNNNGELGIGSNRTKDIPEKINVISSYKQVSSGESFAIALRNDGKVWSFGKNNFGQLGIGNTINGVNPVQVNEITDIVQIATGKEHVIAKDSYGILYGWGNNSKGQLGLSSTTVLTPTVIGYTGGTIQSIWAGDNQSIIINTKGEVYGYGSILNKKLEGITNAVKVSVGNGYMLILTTEGEIYKFDGKTLTKYTGLEQIVDIDVTNGNNIAQTVNEKVYTWQDGETPKLEEMEKIYTISAGVNNSYIIKIDGTVYGKGKNQYGQLGNSTRIDSLDKFTLVGDRTFTIEPENKIMYVGDVENLTEILQINEFNVFNQRIRNEEEYTWLSSEPDIVTVNNGTLTAIADGTAKITVTDTVTGEEVTITRVVIPVEKDRINNITVNNYNAEITDEYKYYVEVETNGNVGTISITTKNNTDKISIDNGATWFENGKLTTQIDITKQKTEVSIIVETTNGTQIPYTLIVKKISTDVSLENITVNGISATAISSTKYEVVVPEETAISEIIARANNNKAQVSINGEKFIAWKSITTLEYESNLQLTIPIVVKAENGDELEYSLTIYKESEALKLESLTINGKEAIKTSETIYSITIARNINEVEVIAKAISELVNVSINNENSQVQISTKQIQITDELTEVEIRLSTTIDGQEVYRDYILNIYKKAESGKIKFVIVNGTVITPKLDNTYEIYLPAETENAIVKVIAENELDYVQIVPNNRQQGSSEANVITSKDCNEYEIIITDEELETSEECKLYIKKPSVDTSIKEITISNGDDVVIAKKSTEEKNTYIAKVKPYNDYKIEVTSNNINAYISINEETKVKNIATKVVTKTADYMEIKITVESENGDLEDYLLKIYVMSSDIGLEYIKVNGTQATHQSDGSYLINLETAETSVSVTAKTVSNLANIKIENEKYDINTTTKDVTIDSKDTIKYIYVKAEDGTTAKYRLVISGLPDDTTLQKVTVNGIEAKYIDGQNKYEIRSDAENFEITAIATDSLVKVAINNEEQSIGTATTTITRTNDVTIVKIKVISQNGIDNTTYTLEIKEKSNDTSIEKITVDGKIATKTLDGNYIAEVVNKTTVATIEVEANDSYSIVYLDNETENTSNITVQKAVVDRNSIYTIKVIAEDGTKEEFTLTIIKLNENTNIKELSVSYELESVDEDTNKVTTEQKTYTPSLQEDGTYYLKIDRVEQVNVKTILEDENAKVKIKNSAYEVEQNEVSVDVVADITRVTISVQAEDGIIKDYTLIIEKKSNDTTIKTITSKDMLKLDGYTIYVDESLNEIDLTLITNDKFAYIKLDSEQEYTQKEITRTIDLSNSALPEDDESEGWLVNINVKAEDGTIENYTIIIVKTGNTNIDNISVNNETIECIEQTYTANVNVAETAEVKIVTENTNAKIEIIQNVEAEDGTITENIIATDTGTILANVPLSKNPQNYIIRITSANGASTYDYKLVITQKSNDTSLDNITVNGEKVILNKESGIYEIEITDKTNIAKIIATAGAGTSKVSIAGETATIKTATKTKNINGYEIIDLVVTITAEDETTKEYNLKITVLENSNKTSYVKINTGTVNSEEDGITYKTFIDYDESDVDIEIKAESSYSNIYVSNSADLEITDQISNDGILKFTVNTPEKVTTIKYKITSQTGIEKEYIIILTKISTDNSLKELYVDNVLIQVDEDRNYYADIENPAEVTVKAIANNQYANIRIDYNEEKVKETEEKVNVDVTNTKVTITITSQSGVSEKYYLYIRILANNTELDKVVIDSQEVTNYKDSTKTYTALVDSTKNTYEIFLMTINDNATVELYDGENIISSGVGNITDILTLGNSEEGHTYTIKVSLDEENYSKYTLVVVRKSNDTSLEIVEVNDVIRSPKTDNPYVYEVGIPKLAETAKIRIVATNKYSTVRIGEYEAVLGGNTVNISLNLNENRTTVPIVVTAADGTTIDTYNILLIRKSNIADLESVVVNNTKIDNINDIYTYYMPQNENIAHTEITVLGNNNATVQVDTNEAIGYLELNINFEPDTIKVEKTIKVKSEDGTVEKEYKLVIWKKTEILGTILTQNFEDKHISKITLLQENEIIKELETNEDGSYKIDIEKIGTYDIKVTKSGYLSYTVKNIEMTAGRVVDLGEYNLIAGDVVETGEIEIDDLVTLNDNYGVNITNENKEIKSIYDLNEDGIIDGLDRNILKANYGKIAESIEWVNPEDVTEVSLMSLEYEETEKSEDAQEFILPMSCNYIITSNYGARIDPITGKKSFHTGIDISGIHHTEIFAVEEGEITFAGVQSGYGNCVEIKHIVNGETIYSFYAHLSQINVQPGEKVKQGDIIGLEGGDQNSDPNPGDTTGHHLHFEIRTASGYGNDVDPIKYISF